MIDIALVPVAGWGTRLLPATKSQPKEMLPVGRKPVVQYVVEELVQSGIRTRLVAVEVNLEIVAHEEHAAHQVQAGDTIEVVTLVGGG